MPTNWPPPTGTYPAWPPQQVGFSLECSDYITMWGILQELGFTLSLPTNEENRAFFQDARCDHGHRVHGRLVYHPSNPSLRWPFCACVDATHQDLLVLWPPYYCGTKSSTGME